MAAAILKEPKPSIAQLKGSPTDWKPIFDLYGMYDREPTPTFICSTWLDIVVVDITTALNDEMHYDGFMRLRSDLQQTW
jgi:hypothetical protein